MRKNFKHVLYLMFALCLAFTIAIYSTEAQAEVDWPGNRVITVLAPSAVGSPNDILAREFGRAVEQLYPGSVFNTVNTLGGGAMFGALMAAPADGNTIASMNSAQIASLQSGLSRDFPFEGFAFVGNTQIDPFTVAVQADAPFQSIEEMVIYARNNPGFTIGGTGTGTMNHMLMIRLSQLADFSFTWIPYTGGAEAVTNLLGGHVHAILTTPTSAQPFEEAGTMRMLAITGHNRLSTEMFSHIPTFIELGFYLPQTQYRGFMVRAGTDPAIIQRMSDVLREATLTDSFVAFMNLNHLDDAFMDHVEFTRLVTEDYIAIGQMLEELMDN